VRGRVIGLGELLRFLDFQSFASLRGPTIDAYFAGHTVEPNEVLDCTRFREDTYARNLVRRTSTYEVLVLGWLAGQKSGIHNHAGQRCWTQVISGVLTFQNFSPIGRLEEKPKPLGRPWTQGPEACVYLDDHEGVHSIANQSAIPAVSLHVYAGPIDSCLVFDEVLGRFKPVELRSFPIAFDHGGLEERVD
jgi:cysteine dioxygenase